MSVMLAGFGGLFCGVLAAFIISLLAAVPFLQWFDYLILPSFYVVAPISGLYIGFKAAGLIG
ncbi:MAG: hypothetical protein F4X64_03475 [Chloroflexi bacterium]|nr:hypothetical protein [Chloroflexota bacterium]